jgi:hypothetical protein
LLSSLAKRIAMFFGPEEAKALDPLPKIFSETEGRKVLDACRMRGIGSRSSGPQSLI